MTNDEGMQRMVMAATKRERMAMAMVMAMRVPVHKEGKAARAMALAMRVACNKEGDGNGGKSDGDKGGGQATARRAMATEKANNNQPATGLTKAGGGWQESINKATTRP